MTMTPERKQIVICGACDEKYDTHSQDMKCPHNKLELAKDQKARPKIICLCGSTRFIEHFNKWRKKLTLEGKIVLSIEIVTTQTRKEDPQNSDPWLKHMLDELHLRKIDLADEVMILNVGGYVGESTAREIKYAEGLGKPIVYLEP